MPAAEATTSDPLARFFEREVSLSRSLVPSIRTDLENLVRVCDGELKQTNAIRSLLSDLNKGTVPGTWKRYRCRDLPASVWIADLAKRLAQLHRIVANGDLAKAPVAPGLLFHPHGYITASRQAVAHATKTSLEELMMQVNLAETGEEHSFVVEGAFSFLNLCLPQADAENLSACRTRSRRRDLGVVETGGQRWFRRSPRGFVHLVEAEAGRFSLGPGRPQDDVDPLLPRLDPRGRSPQRRGPRRNRRLDHGHPARRRPRRRPRLKDFPRQCLYNRLPALSVHSPLHFAAFRSSPRGDLLSLRERCARFASPELRWVCARLSRLVLTLLPPRKAQRGDLRDARTRPRLPSSFPSLARINTAQSARACLHLRSSLSTERCNTSPGPSTAFTGSSLARSLPHGTPLNSRYGQRVSVLLPSRLLLTAKATSGPTKRTSRRGPRGGPTRWDGRRRLARAADAGDGMGTGRLGLFLACEAGQSRSEAVRVRARRCNSTGRHERARLTQRNVSFRGVHFSAYNNQ